MGEHFGAEIRRHDIELRASVLDFQSEIAGAAGDIEQGPRLPGADFPSHAFAPPDVHAATGDMIRHDVAVGNPCEGVSDVSGIWHQREVTQMRVKGKRIFGIRGWDAGGHDASEWLWPR